MASNATGSEARARKVSPVSEPITSAPSAAISAATPAGAAAREPSSAAEAIGPRRIQIK